MNQSEYISSAKVIFSDRGSIYFGFLVIIFMVLLSLGLFILKFQNKANRSAYSNKTYQKQLNSSLVLKQRFSFKPNRANYLLFFFNNSKTNLSLKKNSEEN